MSKLSNINYEVKSCFLMMVIAISIEYIWKVNALIHKIWDKNLKANASLTLWLWMYSCLNWLQEKLSMFSSSWHRLLHNLISKRLNVVGFLAGLLINITKNVNHEWLFYNHEIATANASRKPVLALFWDLLCVVLTAFQYKIMSIMIR